MPGGFTKEEYEARHHVNYRGKYYTEDNAPVRGDRGNYKIGSDAIQTGGAYYLLDKDTGLYREMESGRPYSRKVQGPGGKTEYIDAFGNPMRGAEEVYARNWRPEGAKLSPAANAMRSIARRVGDIAAGIAAKKGGYTQKGGWGKPSFGH